MVFFTAVFFVVVFAATRRAEVVAGFAAALRRAAAKAALLLGMQRQRGPHGRSVASVAGASSRHDRAAGSAGCESPNLSFSSSKIIMYFVFAELLFLIINRKRVGILGKIRQTRPFGAESNKVSHI